MGTPAHGWKLHAWEEKLALDIFDKYLYDCDGSWLLRMMIISRCNMKGS
jgi:hypothetical protein